MTPSVNDDAPTLFQLALSQARIEAKLDTALRTDDDHEKRIRSLESDRDQRSFMRNHAPLLSACCATVSCIGTVIALVIR